MFNPVGSNPVPAAALAAAGSNNNKRKESEKPELDEIQSYFAKHKPTDPYWISYLNRLCTLQNKTSEKDPEFAKISTLIEKFLDAQSVPAEVPSIPAPGPVAQGRKARKGMKEESYQDIYKLRILRNQIQSAIESITNNDSDRVKQEEQKARGLCLLADLFDKYPEDKQIAAHYKHYFQDVAIASEVAPEIAKPERSPLAQQLSDEYDALRKANSEIELSQNDRMEALTQLQSIPLEQEQDSIKISRMDERYIAFSKGIDRIISLLAITPLDVMAIMIELSKETQSPTIERVRNQIILAIANSRVGITKEWLKILLQECSYGSEDAPLNATPAQIHQLIENEKIRHKMQIEKIDKALSSIPDISLLLHFSSTTNDAQK